MPPLETDQALLAQAAQSPREGLGRGTEVGGEIAGVPQEQVEALRTYGDALGIAFQIADDLLDYGGDAKATGKNVGDDFRERKLTLPVIKAVAKADADERAFWERTLKVGDIHENDLSEAIDLIARHNALVDTMERARHYGAIARDALAIFPESKIKGALLEAIDFSVDRPR